MAKEQTKTRACKPAAAGECLRVVVCDLQGITPWVISPDRRTIFMDERLSAAMRAECLRSLQAFMELADLPPEETSAQLARGGQ